MMKKSTIRTVRASSLVPRRLLRGLRRALSLLDQPSSAQEQLYIQLSRLHRRYRQSACSCVACKYVARPRHTRRES